jgi:signal transduction histidine kinase
MRRLYVQIYLTIVASLVLVVLFAGALWSFVPTATTADQAFEMASHLFASQLPPAAAAADAQQRAIDALYTRLHMDLALFAGDRRLLAAAGRTLPAPPPRWESGGVIHGRSGPAWAIRLPDARWIVTRPAGAPARPVLGLFGFLGGIALAVAIGAFPLVRWLTRRLERLQAGVESLGAGDLAARVKVEGRDDVAKLARSFNAAATRIETLVGAHKMLLANASHELRTPLARIRMAIELLRRKPDSARWGELDRDVAELDALIEQILLSSRLEAVQSDGVREDVDLLALAAEEGARYPECSVSGTPVVVHGERALLQRMLRNLIDNAKRHGIPPITVEVEPDAAQAVVTVADHGEGIAASERERSFQPFYSSAADGRTGGTGLGLTLVRQIARQHGGDAQWVGTEKRPSVLRVSIPAHPSVRPSAHPDQRGGRDGATSPPASEGLS